MRRRALAGRVGSGLTYLLPPPPEPLLEPPAPEPAPDPEPGPEPAPGEPALSPLEPPLWPWVLLVAAAPVCLVFFFDLCLADASLSAAPAAEASFEAVCMALDSCALPLMLDVLLFEDLLLLLSLDEVLEVSVSIEELLPDVPLLLSYVLGLEVLDPAVLPMLDAPLPVLELLPLAP